MALEIECHHCKGTGRLPLPQGLWDTLSLLQRNSLIGMTAEQLQGLSADSLKLSAFCNRLKYLMVLGLATRERIGKQWLYKARSTAHARKAGAKGARVRWKWKK